MSHPQYHVALVPTVNIWTPAPQLYYQEGCHGELIIMSLATLKGWSTCSSAPATPFMLAKPAGSSGAEYTKTLAQPRSDILNHHLVGILP